MLVSTHYMDEAERCHRIVYIAYGTIVARGTAEEIIEQSGLGTFVVTGRGTSARGARARRHAGRRAGRRLRRGPARRRLRSATRSSEASRRSRRSFRSRCAPGETTLEDVFIRLMSEAQAGGERLMTAASARQRIRAVLLKEVIQMRRDRLTFAMIVGIPIIQLVLFGYAINTDPKHLPTGIVMADEGPVARAIVAGMQVAGLFSHRRALLRGGGARRRSPTARSPSSSPSRTNFHSDLVRGRDAQIVIEADATDPVRLRQRRRRHAGDRAPRGRRRRPTARSRAPRGEAAPRSSCTSSTIRRASPPSTSCRA